MRDHRFPSPAVRLPPTSMTFPHSGMTDAAADTARGLGDSRQWRHRHDGSARGTPILDVHWEQTTAMAPPPPVVEPSRSGARGLTTTISKDVNER